MPSKRSHERAIFYVPQAHQVIVAGSCRHRAIATSALWQ